MFGTQEMIQYLRFLRHKEELDNLMKKFILTKKCDVCGFEFISIENIYTKLPIVSYTYKKDVFNLVCNGCRKEFINQIIENNKK